jgi:hypothetical protein
MRDLMKNTPRKIRNRLAEHRCSGKQRVWGYRDWEGEDIIATEFAVKCTSGPRYSQIWWFDDIGPAARVWVWCDCPFFTYYLEVADAADGSSDVINSNGQPPRIRNPRMVPYLCKHLWYVAGRVMTPSGKLSRPRRLKTPSQIQEERAPSPAGTPMERTIERLRQLSEKMPGTPRTKSRARGKGRSRRQGAVAGATAVDQELNRILQRNHWLEEML